MSQDWIALGVAGGSLAVSAAAYIRAGRWRASERRDATPRFDVMTKSWFTLGIEGTIVLSRVEVIAQNVSTAEVTVTELHLAPVDLVGPTRVFTGKYNSFPQTITPGKALYYTILPIAFTELLDNVSGLRDAPEFSVSVQSGHGSEAKSWSSAPFSVAPVKQVPDGYSEWVE